MVEGGAIGKGRKLLIGTMFLAVPLVTIGGLSLCCYQTAKKSQSIECEKIREVRNQKGYFNYDINKDDSRDLVDKEFEEAKKVHNSNIYFNHFYANKDNTLDSTEFYKFYKEKIK